MKRLIIIPIFKYNSYMITLHSYASFKYFGIVWIYFGMVKKSFFWNKVLLKMKYITFTMESVAGRPDYNDGTTTSKIKSLAAAATAAALSYLQGCP